MKKLVFAWAVLSSVVLFAGVYDDCLWWFNGPVEKSDGTIGRLENGEVVDILHGGLASGAAATVTDSAKPIRVVTDTVETHYFSKPLPYISFRPPEGQTTANALIDIGPSFNPVYTKTPESFTTVLRFRWDSANKAPGATDFMLAGMGFSFGIYSSGSLLRIYPGTSSIADLPVVGEVWYDVAFSVTPLAVGGSHFECLLVGAGKDPIWYEKDFDSSACPSLPQVSSDWNRWLGSEGTSSTKFFSGDIQQLAFWTRKLSRTEMIEAFRMAQPDAALVGVTNDNGAEFGGTAGSAVEVDLDTTTWAAVPKTFGANDSWTVKFTLDAGDIALHALRIKSAAGAATFSATINGETSTAVVEEGETGDLLLLSSALVQGENSVVLTRTDGGADFTLDALSLVTAGYLPDVRSYSENAVINEDLRVDGTDTMRVFDVAEGVTVTYNGVISGPRGIVKRGLGTLILTAANTYEAGAIVEAGVLEIRNRQALGTGTARVDGSQTHQSQLVFNHAGTTIANPLVVATASSRAYPAVKFQAPTTLTGGVTLDADLYFATGCENDPSAARAVYVRFQSLVKGGEDVCLAGAPHNLVSFERGLQVDILEGYYVPGAGANGGNAGAFRVSRDDTTKNANAIKRIVLDQTSFICGNSNVADGSLLEYTGEHPADGYGYFDLNGCQINNLAVYTGEACKTATSGLQLLNSSDTASTLKFCNVNGSANWYFVLEGKINVTWAAGGTAPTFLNRRHTMVGSLAHNRSHTIGLGASFPNVTSSGGSSGSVMTVDSTEPDVFDSLKNTTHGSSSIKLNTAEAVASLGRGHKLRMESNRTTKIDGKDVSTGDPSYGILVKAGETLDIASAKLHPRNDVHTLVEVPCGEYTVADYCEFCRGTFRVWAPRTTWTDITWSGSDDASFGDAANWTGNPATFTLPLNKATVASGSSATVEGLVNLGGLAFAAAAGDFTFNGTGVLALYDAGLRAEKGAADRTITFNVPVDCETDEGFAIPAGDTIVFAGGLTNGVWRMPATNLVLAAANAGQVTLNGKVPRLITVNGGELAFGANAEVTDDEIELTIADGGKLVVPEGIVLRVKTLKYAGSVKEVGYYTSADGFITGGGAIRVAESSVTPTPVTLIWAKEGADGDVTTSENWADSPFFDFSFANKYIAKFAQAGNTAVVSGPVNWRGISFEAPTAAGFTVRKGGEDAVITLGDDAIKMAFTAGADGHDYAIEPTIALTKDLSISINTNDSLRTSGLDGAHKVTVNGNSWPEYVVKTSPQVLPVAGEVWLGGTNTFTGALEVRNAICHFSGQMGAADDASTASLRTSQQVSGKYTDYGTYYFDGVDMYKAVSVGSAGMGAAVLNNSYNIIFSPGTTNRFARMFTYSSSFSVRFESDSKTVFEKGFTGGNTATFNDCENTHQNAEIVFNGPLDVSSAAKGSVTFGGQGLYTKYVLNATGGKVGMDFDVGYRAKVVECNADYVLKIGENYPKASMKMGYDGSQTGASVGTLRLNGVKFATPQMQFKRGAIVEGTLPGAQFEVTGGSPNTTGYFCRGTFVGCVDLVVKGTNLVQLTNNDATERNTSTGCVKVVSGTLEFGPDSSWRDGTDFYLQGGTLKFNAARQVNRKTASFHFRGGQVEISKGVNLTVNMADVDGTPVPYGTYRAGDGSALGNFISGEGTLRVRNGDPGTLLIIR